jgi:hypothetical protein
VLKRVLVASPALAILLFAGFWTPPHQPELYDSTRWIDEGLEAERTGNLSSAEHDLLEATKVDRLFLPRWTLAGFYFRHGPDDRFWQWAREGLAVGRRDLGALFELCWKKSDNPDFIWNAVMPDRKATWDEYLFYLMTTHRWPAAAMAANRIAAIAEKADEPLLLNYCDLALANHDGGGAREVWNQLCRRHILPYAPSLLTNGDLRNIPMARGFDWRITSARGLRQTLANEELHFSLTGDEPEQLTLLEQPLALPPGESYKFQFDYKTSVTGLHWEAADIHSADLASAAWTTTTFIIQPVATKLAWVYRRAPGTTLAHGEISLRRMDIVPQ